MTLLASTPGRSTQCSKPTACRRSRHCHARRKANAYAERRVRTLRQELLDRTIIWNERQLLTLLVDYLDHYNQHRPHRSLDQAATDDTNVTTIDSGQSVVQHGRCGGLNNEYRHAPDRSTRGRPPHRSLPRRAQTHQAGTSTIRLEGLHRVRSRNPPGKHRR